MRPISAAMPGRYPYFWSKVKIAAITHHSPGEGELLVTMVAIITHALQAVEENQCLVEYDIADAVRQQQILRLRRKGSQPPATAATLLSAAAATRVAWLSKSSGPGSQSTFTALANADIGWASIPMLEMPSFLHSTSTVPVPQNGSRTRSAGPTPNRSQ